MSKENKTIAKELIFDIKSNIKFFKVTHLFINNKPEIC